MVNPESARSTVAGKKADPAVAGLGDRDWFVSEGWPPVSYAENDHILVWWLPEYDDLLRRLVDEYQWAWQSQALARLQAVVPDTVLLAWRDADPLCAEWAWYNVLGTFAAARAKQLGIRPRPPRFVICSCCSREFLESHLSHSFILRLGLANIDVCDTCLGQALNAKGSTASTAETVTAVLQALWMALQRPPKRGDLSGRLDLKGLTRDARSAAVQALRVKPTVPRVEELFGSWDTAVAHASAVPAVPLPAYEPPAPVVPAETEFTSIDPARYQAAMGVLPSVTLDPCREQWTYEQEVQSFIGTGYLALAEAVLAKLARPGEPGLLISMLADLYGQTARFDEARAAIEGTYGENGSAEHLLKPRDFRTITPGPAFYETLPSAPRGNARFVLIGGPMEYVDRRGVHHCVTGDSPGGGPAPELAESVARMNAMVDSDAWMRAVTETGQAIMTSLTRAGADPRPYGHLVTYVATPFRDAVKALTGSLPKKVPEDAWRIGAVNKSRWSYQRDAGQYIFNARAGYAFITVDAVPAVSIWAWADRSDLCLQAFVDTVTAGTSDPVTVILPDVPALRAFARRYVWGERMGKIERTLMEERLYRPMGEGSTKRGYVLSAEFAPRLVVHADGTEDDGMALAGALGYLDVSHTLRLSVWDVLSDVLLREIAALAPVEPRPSSVPAHDRTEMLRWYAQYAEFDDVAALLSMYRPSLLDAVLT
jgi:hypothetical protein